MLMPFYFLITTSLKTGPEVLSGSALSFPSSPTFQNFVTLLSPSSDASGAILKGLLYSLIITGGTIVGLIVLGSPAAYVLTRSTSRWSSRTYYLFLIAILLPTQLGIVPLYVEARNLGLTGSPWGMIVIYTGVLMPLSVFLYGGVFRPLPRDYEEAGTPGCPVPTRRRPPSTAPPAGRSSSASSSRSWARPPGRWPSSPASSSGTTS